jgi:hypothetical protein
MEDKVSLSPVKKALTSASVLVIFLCTGLLGCDDQVYDNIPQEKRTILGDGDTLIFMDEHGIRDTMLLEVNRGYENSDKRYNHELFSIRYSKLKNNKVDTKDFLYVLQSTGSVLISSLGASFYVKQTLDSYTLSNGEEIHSVFMEEPNPQYVKTVTRVYYHYRYGVIHFEYTNGRKMELLWTR